MILAIKEYPDPVLRKKCSPVQILQSPSALELSKASRAGKNWSGQEVKKLAEEIKKLGLDMLETMIVNQGVGLAAPQVGVLKRIIVTKFEEGPRVFVNPKILKKSKEKILEEEGCLSFPGLFLKIKRAREVEVEALNENGEKISLKAEGLPARVFQHEIDHLDGILFIDRLSFWQKLKLKGKLKEYEPR